MIGISATTQIYFYNGKTDFRKGIDGLAFLCKTELCHDPFSGAVFVFMSTTRTSIKILHYDGQGFWACTKRLSKGKFRWIPPQRDTNEGSTGDFSKKLQILLRDFQVLLWNGNPEKAAMQPNWRDV